MCTGTQGVCHVVDRVPDSANLPDWPRDDPERHATRPQLVHVIAAVVAVKAPQSRGSPSMQTAIAAP
ncbi:hypothetical protein HMPREF9621_01948 [Cutibacterium modestum HL037PA2]|nr:hypothetical protein HMPREF9621_01948 [Cutibacterium modestum HL037PA2]